MGRQSSHMVGGGIGLPWMSSSAARAHSAGSPRALRHADQDRLQTLASRWRSSCPIISDQTIELDEVQV
jgi:hypothetical protein